MNKTGPLSGITIVDLSRVLAGPYCTMLLGELGARVIKIEPPEGDDARKYGPFVNGESAYFASYNRGKESIVLDFKHASDLLLLNDLLNNADVLLENFRPGVMAKFGLDWDSVHSKHPKLIYASTSGFGQSGPLALFPAYDLIVQAMSGLMSITGYHGQAPARAGYSIGDLGAGLFTAVAVNAALYHRAVTGEGTRIDVSMFDCQVALMDSPIVRHLATGQTPGPLGARHPNITPFEAYPTADRTIIIAAGNDRLFAKLTAVLDLPNLQNDPRFESNELRTENVDALFELMSEVLKTRPASHWFSVFEMHGIPYAPINNVPDVVNNEQLLSRNMLITVEDEAAGPIRASGNPMKFTGFADLPTRKTSPRLDADRQSLIDEFGPKTEISQARRIQLQKATI